MHFCRNTQRLVCNATIVAVLSLMFPRQTRADSLSTAVNTVIVGIVVASVAVGVGVSLLVLHEKHKKTSITGCITSGESGVSLTDEKDNRSYRLAGLMEGIKPGERMTLEGKRHGPVFETNALIKDFGSCRP